MLIHKRSLGVLETIYRGESYKDPITFKEIPLYYSIQLEDLPESERDEYWEVKNGSKLAKRIHINYPNFTPLTDENGDLIDIIPLTYHQEKVKEEKKELREDARKRGYKSWNRKRTNGMIDFLKKNR